MTTTQTGWDVFRDTVRGSVPTVAWQNWLETLGEGEKDGDGLVLVAPTDFHAQWVRDKYRETLQTAAAVAYGSEVKIRIMADDTEPEPPSDVSESEPVSTPDTSPTGAGAPSVGDPPARVRAVKALNDRYRFDNFVVGPSNRFAHAAAMAVAEQPGAHYNPLFIYASAGLGKTHLLNAVGHHLLELQPGAVVRYVTSEAFFNEFIEGIRTKRMDAFKNRYRNTDLLLLDDVQFFEGKEQILEEFFHTFNALYESGKQMVITSDRHPRSLSSLEDRLRSRFEWGLLTDIQSPDIETRIAILRKNAELVPHWIPEDVLTFIAANVTSNIRELEGALTRISAFATLTQNTVNLEMAHNVLSDLRPADADRPLSVSEIIERSAATFGFDIDDLCGPSRRQPLVLARQIAMYLARELTDLSLPKIGAEFGRDHTTVMHAIDKIKRLIQSDHDVFERVNRLSRELRRTPS